MEDKNTLSVTIVDRNYPPNRSVIAESASDLAKFLIANEVEVQVVHTDGKYQGGGSTGEIVGQTHQVASVYNGKNKGIRLFSSLIEGYRLIRKAKKVNKGILIVMTSPPLLNFWASRMLNRKKIPWVFWSMDLYPEAFVAGKLISNQHFLFKFFFNQTYKNPPNGLIALGNIQSKYIQESFRTSIPNVILPCGVFLHKNKSWDKEVSKPAWKKNDEKIYLGYIGNLGEAHSVSFLKSVIDHFDREKQTLILVVYGSKSLQIKEYIDKDDDQIVLLDFVPREHLAFIDIHLVSLKPEWVNVCVPSKLVSAVNSQSIFLFYGIRSCDSWQLLNKAGWIIEKSKKDENNIADFLAKIKKSQLERKRKEAVTLSADLEENTKIAYQNILSLLENIHS